MLKHTIIFGLLFILIIQIYPNNPRPMQLCQQLALFSSYAFTLVSIDHSMSLPLEGFLSLQWYAAMLGIVTQYPRKKKSASFQVGDITPPAQPLPAQFAALPSW